MSIRKLPAEVVNKIAAGEVLVRPVNAVKELVENSIDAGATQISLTIGNGGLQTIQILDNGCGIDKADHALLCERFATSKLTSSDDLNNGKLNSFGFRGEALSSMSLVAHVSVTSRSLRSEDQCAYESRYSMGKLLPDSPSIAVFGQQFGTRISVEDLFFNYPVRKKAFKVPSAEYRRILDLIARFAIAFPDIGFRLNKAGDINCDIAELSKAGGHVERIQSVIGISATDLILVLPAANDLPSHVTACSAVVSRLNTVSHGASAVAQYIVVVNKRLVELPHLIKGLESECMSQLDAKPRFLFLSLTIDPGMIDVNVCPTKGKVVFKNQSVVERWIIDQIVSALNDSRRVKMMKLTRIEFSSSNMAPPRLQPNDVVPINNIAEVDSPPALVIAKEEVIAPSQPFRIHTCPQQSQLIRVLLPTQFAPTQPTNDRGDITLTQMLQSQLKFISLSQSASPVDPPTTATDDAAFDPSVLLTINRLSNTYDSVLWSHHPRDFVFVGAVTEDFALCQYFAHLCICNVRYVFDIVVGRFLLLNKFSLKTIEPVGVNGHELPEWVKAILGVGACDSVSFSITRIPSILGTLPSDHERHVQELVHSLTGLDLDTPSDSSIQNLISAFNEFIFNAEFSRDLKHVWNEVVKGKRFISWITAQNNGKSTSGPPLLDVDRNKKFLFREVITLKELYKEFERC